MTLIAAFRASKGGVLLCADRYEDDGVSKRAVDKIYRIRDLNSAEVFIAGAGPITPIKNACIEIHKALQKRNEMMADLVVEHPAVIESSLKSIYERHTTLETWPMNLIIVVAPREVGRAPFLYQTDRDVLCPESFYVSQGSGKSIADYFSSRLYAFDLMERWLIIMASFVFRETAESASGVGLGTDMVLINNGRPGLRIIPPEAVRQVQNQLPQLNEALHNSWMSIDETVKFPSWLDNDFLLPGEF